MKEARISRSTLLPLAMCGSGKKQAGTRIASLDK
jgi:hypothetical protein